MEHRTMDEMDGITDPAAFLSFLRDLAADFRERPLEWENTTVDSYLEAIASWIEDAGGYDYIAWDRFDWSGAAKMLYMGKIYE